MWEKSEKRYTDHSPANISTSHNVDTTSVPDVEKTLKQRRNNVAQRW